MINYKFSCIHHRNIKSDDKLIVVETQILLMLDRSLTKPSKFFFILWPDRWQRSVGIGMLQVN